VLPDLVRIHKARNVQLRGRSLLDDPAVYAEFTGRVLAHAEEDKVRLLVTRIDDAMAAFALCLLDERTLRVYANLVAPEWLMYSAGTITNHAVVAWARCSDDIDVIDWGLGVQRYKLSGPIELVPHSRVEVYSSLAAEAAVRATRSMRSALRPFLARATETMR
jgi:CelD/BcsL family acetyltransferase involved in cellulose biosynthesis